MVDLNGHEAGNGGYSQRTPNAHRGLLYSEGPDPMSKRKRQFRNQPELPQVSNMGVGTPVP